MVVGMRLLVDPPTRMPLPFSLWSTVQNVDEVDVHFQAGTTWQPDVCDEADVTLLPCPTPPAAKTPTSDGLPSYCSEPFTVYAWIDCGPVGNWGSNGEVFKARALAALEGGEARAVEREFWTGAHGTNPHLAADAAITEGGCILQQAAVIPVAGAVSAQRAIGILEGAIASCSGSVGVIHIPFGAVASLPVDAKVTAGKLFTFAGTPVVAGAGYPGTSPAGVAAPAGQAWLYGTGPIVGRRSAVRITEPHESLDRSVNSEVIVAERTVSLGWDCCLYAVLATL